MKPVNPKLDIIMYSCLTDVVNEVQANNDITFLYTQDAVPETGKAIYSMWREAKRGRVPFKVFNGSNDAENLYFSPEVNLLYRTVHDIDHAIAYAVGRGTTKYEDELYLNCLMAKRIHDWTVQCSFYTEADALEVFFAVYHDTVGQVQYYKEHGDFCADQRTNTIRLMNGCTGVSFLKHGMLTPARQVMLSMLNECGV